MHRLRRADVPLATDTFARFLIGTLLMRRFDDGSILSGRIVETEAYTPEDPASHAFRGPTARNRAMFGENFHAYVYFIYGTAYCLNISSEARGIGAAVLIRALEPIEGLDIMRARRGVSAADRDLLRGPGRLCAAFDIDRVLDGADLETDSRLWLASDGSPAPAVGESTRIGLTKATDVPHRFFARGSPFLSGQRKLSGDPRIPASGDQPRGGAA
jgi:DNA-3-methyladenine glycosylase